VPNPALALERISLNGLLLADSDELQVSTHCGQTAFLEADIEVNARCLLLRGRGNKMTARPSTPDDECVYAAP